jgi:hypothetical protein
VPEHVNGRRCRSQAGLAAGSLLSRPRQRPTQADAGLEESVDVGVVLIGVGYVAVGVVGDATGPPA